MAWFKKQPPVPAPVDPEVFKVVARAPVLNPSAPEQLKFAEYRADAIARDMEQRDTKHDQHDMIFAEAMTYAWMLVGAKKWTVDNLRAFEARLRAAV